MVELLAFRIAFNLPRTIAGSNMVIPSINNLSFAIKAVIHFVSALTLFYSTRDDTSPH